MRHFVAVFLKIFSKNSGFASPTRKMHTAMLTANPSIPLVVQMRGYLGSRNCIAWRSCGLNFVSSGVKMNGPQLNVEKAKTSP